ncbi:sensor histidine kinase [Jiangella mangrovi]|uniref:histidine kinase n=1 Tax=Jiangella mangrovi TaxID=1524084 RepID=A0A7W9GNK2_9ACTN|nr:sensor histidine kinase [Jiangella mangrovi]MBB5787159.1 signal transduction histidine kinase [Jiangella mangrovi]
MTRTARGRRSNDGATKRARANLRPADLRPSVKSGRAKEGGADGERSQSFWHTFLHDRSVRSRVAALVLLPLLGTLVLGTLFFKSALDEASSASRTESLAELGMVSLQALETLQDERDVTGLAEVGPGGAPAATGDGAVDDARAATDAALASLSDEIDQRRGDDLGSGFESAVAAFDRQLPRLAGYRGQRDANDPPFESGTDGYQRIAQTLQQLATASGTGNDDPVLARQISALADIAQAVESASMERGLVAYFIGPEALTSAQRDQVVILQGEQDLLLQGRFLRGLGFTDQARLFSNQITEGNRLVADTRSDITNGAAPRATKEEWYQASTDRIDALREVQNDTSGTVLTVAADRTDSSRVTALLSALAVLAVLALTVYLAIVVARSIIGPLRRLRASALETAQTQLPALVDRVHKDGPAVARNLPDAVEAEGRDEIGQVATAFNDVHSTAVRVAAEQAMLRQNLDTIVVNLSRRTQSLIDRQLGEIEGLEQRERDPDQLSTLFRIDHMATRVRRHAESLLVLAGVDEMRKHTSAAGVLDVVRTAVGEVEQYPRVKFGVMPTDLITAGAVDDIAHLLAELIDNATEFSAPATPVRVTSQPLLGGGLRLQVTDSGLGIPAGQLDELNDRLRNVGDIDVAASRTLGLYVVARLAAKHGIQVRLEGVPEGGTAAQVDLPAHLILSPLDTSEGVLSAVTPETQAPKSSGLDAWSLDNDSSPFRRDDSSPSLPLPSTTGLPRRSDERPEPTRFPVEANGRLDEPFPADPAPAMDAGRPTWPSPEESRLRADTGETRVPPITAETRFQADTGEARLGDTAERRLSDTGESPLSDTGERRFSTDHGTRSDESWRAPLTGAGTNGSALPTREPRPEVRPPAPQPAAPAVPPAPAPAPAAARASLRAPEPVLPDSDSPIYDSVASAWFSRSSSPSTDWSSPADEGWRRAAEALRSAEEAASARAGQRDTEPIATSPQIGSGWAASRPETPAPAPAPVPEPVAEAEPALSASGLPLRRRGASLVPGSIGELNETERTRRPAAAAKDASNVASTLASLQRGVGRGREETGGWVPKRPSDPERSDS